MTTLARPHTRSQSHGREPLSTLLITLFVPPANTLPSPISLPAKRGPSTSAEDIGSARKVSRTQRSGTSTPSTSQEGVSAGKKKTPNREKSTPRRVVLDRDELGTGKSPARRLFTDRSPDQGRRISGISGAIATTPSASSSSHRALAPLPPLPDSPRASSSQQSPFLVSDAFGLDGLDGNNVNVNIHDPGFIVHPDPIGSSTSTSTGMRTPRSLRSRSNTIQIQPQARATRTTTPTPSISLPSSPISDNIDLMLDNQENIPPPPRSTTSTPSKHDYDSESDISGYLSISSYSRSPSTTTSGSGTRRRERSKLANEVYVLRGETINTYSEEKVEEEEELTPGRKVLDKLEKGKARELLAMEVDEI